MLSQRFPLLCAVPDAVLAEHLLDGSHVRIRFTVRRMKHDTLLLATAPRTEVIPIVHRLRGFSMPVIPMEVPYEVEVDEQAQVSAFVDGSPVSSPPLFLQVFLQRCFPGLFRMVERLVEELQTLPSVAVTHQCVIGNLHGYWKDSAKNGSIQTALQTEPTLHMFCFDCLQHMVGNPAELTPAQEHVSETDAMVRADLEIDERVWQTILRMLQASAGQHPLLHFDSYRHEEFQFLWTRYRLIEAVARQHLHTVFAQEREVFLGERLTQRSQIES